MVILNSKGMSNERVFFEINLPEYKYTLKDAYFKRFYFFINFDSDI